MGDNDLTKESGSNHLAIRSNVQMIEKVTTGGTIFYF